MTFNVNDDEGAQALHWNQLLDRWQNSVKSGCAVTINSGTLGQSDTLAVAAGTVIVAGTEHSVSAGNAQIDAADSTNPRKDVVYIDSSGTIQVAKGDAEAATPSIETGPDTYRPAPPDLDATDATVLYEVWVAAGASSIDAGDLTDRRVDADLVAAAVTADSVAAGSVSLDDTDSVDLGTDDDTSWSFDPTLGASGAAVLRDEVNSQDVLRGEVGGNVEIPNGDLLLGGNNLNVQGGNIYNTSVLEPPNGPLTIKTSGSGHAVVINDQANAQNILVANEGGNVEIPNGNLLLSDNTLLFPNQKVYESGGQNLVLDVSGSGNYGAIYDSTNGQSLLKATVGGNVEIPNGNLRLATGQSLEDGSGTDRIGFFSTNTTIRDDTGTSVFDAISGTGVRLRGRANNPVIIRDDEGSFTGVQYLTAASAPGTLELTNAGIKATGTSSGESFRWPSQGGSVDPSFFIDSNGEIFARDDDNNTTQLT